MNRQNAMLDDDKEIPEANARRQTAQVQVRPSTPHTPTTPSKHAGSTWKADKVGTDPTERAKNRQPAKTTSTGETKKMDLETVRAAVERMMAEQNKHNNNDWKETKENTMHPNREEPGAHKRTRCSVERYATSVRKGGNKPTPGAGDGEVYRERELKAEIWLKELKREKPPGQRQKKIQMKIQKEIRRR